MIKKYFKQWSDFFETGGIKNKLHLFFQAFIIYFIFVIAIFVSFAHIGIYQFGDAILIMTIPALFGYFSNKQTAERLRTNVLKIGTKLKIET